MRIGVFVIVIAIIGIIFGVKWFTAGRWIQGTDDAYVNGFQNTVTSQVDGRITELYIKDTQTVKEGDLLAVIDDTDYKINFEKAEANLAKAVKTYYSLNSSADQYSDVIKSLRSSLQKAQADYKRDNAAYKQGLISKETYDATANNLDQAQTSLNKALKEQDNARIQAISSSIYTHPEVKAAIVSYKEAYVNLERTKIYAPISGVVAKKSVYIGQKVSANQELLTLIDLNDIWVDGNMKENQLKNIKIGNKVELKSDVNGKKYTGYVTGISAGTGNAFSILPAQNATGNWIKIVQRIPVRIDIDKDSIKENGAVSLGSSMIIDVDTKEVVENPNVNNIKEQKTNLYTIDESAINHKISEIIDANLGRR
ncbi:efflux RND transporter periplasmic adaptor subunit [Sebaldella sp. S0638]|uniref:efflux RND transporter periplasmic adaptor subunit n=1 Tax=Sebaldella sp. S0638 TaxID=2957809 RepID=UPI00209ED527|nr:HlyD family secretion protein [Sebaldella sp. S0638]